MLGWMSSPNTVSEREGDVIGALSGAAAGVMTGLLAGTRVATGTGWRRIEAIAPGDKVLTFDHGMQVVTKVTHARLWQGKGLSPRRFWPLEIPVGLLGNRAAMRILPAQPVMLESDTAETVFGDAFPLIRARALEGLQGVVHMFPQHEAEVVLLHFLNEQVVFSEEGGLFLCPSSRDLIERAFEGEAPLYSILSAREALCVVEALEGHSGRSFPAIERISKETFAA